jgi:hypothetical protein
VVSLSILRRKFGNIALATWFAAMIGVGSSLLAKHVVALPQPQSSLLAPSINALRTPAERGQWLAVHVLYSDCRCFQRIADHLAGTERPPGSSEMILWVGPEAPARDLTERFDVRHVSARDLSTFGVEAAPSLIVVDPNGSLRYAGGYTNRKQGPAIEDLRILKAIQSSTQVETLPLSGCAVSSRLKSKLSPTHALRSWSP